MGPGEVLSNQGEVAGSPVRDLAMEIEGLLEPVFGDGLIAHSKTDDDLYPTPGSKPADPLEVLEAGTQAGEDLLVHREVQDHLGGLLHELIEAHL